MKVVAVGLAAVAAFVLYRYVSASAAPAPVYYPPPAQPPAKHWYDTALGFLGTVGGSALGTYAALAPRSTPTPVKNPYGMPTSTFTSTDANWIKANMR